MTLLKIKTPRSARYLKWIRRQPSVISGQADCEAHHLIGHGQGGMAMTSSDYYAIPLTHPEHMDLHRIGWREWEDRHGSQWMFVARMLEKLITEDLI